MLALLVWALATYGLVVGLSNLIRYLHTQASFERRVTMVLIVCNGEGYVEGVLRGIAYKAFLSRKELKLVVVDTGSQDSTCEIVRRMQERDARIDLVETDNQFDTELLQNLWMACGTDSPFVLFDLRGWRNPRKIILGLTRIVG